MHQTHERISLLLPQICNGVKDKHIPITYLIQAFGQRGFGVLLIMFSGITILPIPGIALIFALPVFLLSVQMILGKPQPWLPQWFARKTLKRETLFAMSAKLTPYLIYLERFCSPRMFYMTSRYGERMIGVLGMLCGISMTILIPFCHTLPAMAIVIMALGLIERDGLAVIIGMVVAAIGITVLGLLLFSAEHFLVGFFR
jgi:hypothetical protein